MYRTDLFGPRSRRSPWRAGTIRGWPQGVPSDPPSASAAGGSAADRFPLALALARRVVGTRAGNAALLAAVQVAGSLAASLGQPGRLVPDTPLAVALLLAGPAALLLVRRPVPWAVICVGAAVAYLAIGYAHGPVLLSAGIALVLAVVAGGRLAAWSVFAVGVIVGTAASRLGQYPLRVLPALEFFIWGVVLLALAEVVRGRRESAAVWARARSQERLRQAGEQRLQVVRDLQEGVAHEISLIGVRAGVALHVLESGGQGAGEQAHAALAAIRRASDEVLAELRSAVRLLRAEEESVPRPPVPGLGGLPALVRQWAGAGLRVRIAGDAGPLPAAVDQAAYRVVQEALTNVSRHSAATRADIGLQRDGDQLTIVVADPGPARGSTSGRSRGGSVAPLAPDPEPAGGRGLLGMRERVAVLGGAASAGPEGQGWVVQVVLPAGPAR